MCCSSGAAEAGFTGTTSAPSRSAAYSATMNRSLLPDMSSIRSPLLSPAALKAFAARFTASSNSA